MPANSVAPIQFEGVIRLLERAGVVCQSTRFLPKRIIFAQGAPATKLYYIRRGLITLSTVNDRGQVAVTAILSSGAVLGEAGLKPGAFHSSTAFSLVECSTVALQAQQVRTAMHDRSDVAEFFVNHLLERIAGLEENLVDQLVNGSEQRVAHALISLARATAGPPAKEVIRGVSQEVLAHLTGTTRSRVSYFVNKFRRLGYLESAGEQQSFRIDISKLQRILED